MEATKKENTTLVLTALAPEVPPEAIDKDQRSIRDKISTARVVLGARQRSSANVNIHYYLQEAPPEPEFRGVFHFYRQETPLELKAVVKTIICFVER